MEEGKCKTKRKFGPPISPPDRHVPDELLALGKRPAPLLERLEILRDSPYLELHAKSRNTIDEALRVLRRHGYSEEWYE